MWCKISSWSFGFLVITVGFINLRYGNDADFGLFLIVVSFFYFPPVQLLLKTRFGLTIPVWIKIVCAVLLIWVNLAVGAIAEGYVF